MHRAVFLDRDGTLGGDGGYCHPDAFQLFLESFEAISLLNASDLKVVVVTNQTHIGKGDITLAQVEASFRRLQADLAGVAAHFDGWYICPHLPEDHCRCRKPSPYLLGQAASELDLDLAHSYMVGDVGSHDLLAGAAVGCRTILVRTLGLGFPRSLSPYLGQHRPEFHRGRRAGSGAVDRAHGTGRGDSIVP